MNTRDYIPTDPGEIDHVLYLLREDLRPEYRKLIREGKMREYGVAGRLRDALTALIHQHVTGWKRPRDKSDFASLTADSSIEHWIRAAASAVCSINFLESCADRRAVDGIDPEDDKLEWLPDWDRLRVALIELALSLTHAELIDPEKKAAQAARHAQALAQMEEKAKQAERRAQELAKTVEKVKPLIERQGKNTMLPKTAFYIRMIKSNPTMGNVDIANHIFDTAPASNDGESHFYWNGRHELIDRSCGEPIKVKQMAGQIQKARSEHVNGRKHRAKKKVR